MDMAHILRTFFWTPKFKLSHSFFPSLMRSPKHARLILSPEPVTVPSECPSRVAIEKLSEGVLLTIFRYYLGDPPRFSPRLVHVCRKWRRIVFASQRALHLRLFCTHGTPVSKALDFWPALPIAVEYGGSPALDPPAPQDEDDILAALKQSNRVSSINLTITKSLLEKISSIEGPFSELDELVLLSQDHVWPTLPGTFRWGPQLRSLHLTRIIVPVLPQLLYTSTELVDLQLHMVAYLSPEELANALSQMTQLQSLSLHLLCAANVIGVRPPYRKRVVLLALTCLQYRGTSKYLDSLVARIDTPRLADIEITFFNEFTFDVSNLSKFIDRMETQKSHRQADILFSERSVSISLTHPSPTCLKLQVVCGPLSQQLFSLAPICSSLSASLLCVEDLRIRAMRPSSRQDDAERCLELIRLFRGTKWFHVAGDFSTDIVLALHQSGRRGKTGLLPALHKLYIWEPGSHCAPLRTAVVSLRVSRWLSGHFIWVEYEQSQINELRDIAPQPVMIAMLSDDVLLNVFRHYQDVSPRSWPTLVHICQRWRQILFTSPVGLHLRLYCTYGTPVLKTLECWPSLPLVVNYGGSPMLDPPAPEDEENIMVALKQSDRVFCIGLTVTNSLLENLSTISEPFLGLEELVLLSRDNLQLTLPSAFRWGPRLRTLHLTGIVIPALPRLLSPSTGLVDLQLHEIPNVGYFSPDAFANALSETTQLERLSLHFLSFPPRRDYVSLPPQPGARVVLPALTCLKYRGTSKYLDSFVARIDAPRLGDINITFFSQPTMDTSHLGRFIERIEIQTSLSEADVQTSAHAISICFSKPGALTRLQLQISCEQLDWQLSSMSQICNHFSPFLFRVEDLGISSTKSPSRRDDMDGDQWLELIRAFDGAKDFRVLSGVHAMDVLCALRPADGGHATGSTTVLPSLCNLRIEEPMTMHGPSWDAVQSFVTLRWLSSRPVQVYARTYSCHICDASFTEQPELRAHLVHRHAYRIVCSYCSDFEGKLNYDVQFRKHLASKHPEVVHTDTLISNPTSQSFSSYSGSHSTKHGDLRASVILEHFTKLEAPNIPLPEVLDDNRSVIHLSPSPPPSPEPSIYHSYPFHEDPEILWPKMLDDTVDDFPYLRSPSPPFSPQLEARHVTFPEIPDYTPTWLD